MANGDRFAVKDIHPVSLQLEKIVKVVDVRTCRPFNEILVNFGFVWSLNEILIF